MPGSAPSVDNDLLSSLGETLLVFEHLFDTGRVGVSRVGMCRWWGCAVGGVDRVRAAGEGCDGRPAVPARPSPPLFSTCFFTPISRHHLFLHTDQEVSPESEPKSRIVRINRWSEPQGHSVGRFV